MEREQYIQGKLFVKPEKSDQKVYTATYPQYFDRTEKLQQVIRKLRERDLKNGHCFMVFDERLEEDEAFYEYPNGQICIERLDKNNIEVPREVIRMLDRSEIKALRSKHAVIR
jgi:hypothetical protein